MQEVDLYGAGLFAVVLYSPYGGSDGRDDEHQFGLDSGGDGDGLRFTEELVLGMDPEIADENGDGVLDGVALAKYWAAIIDALLSGYVGEGQPSLFEYVEGDCSCACPICGETVTHDRITSASADGQFS